MKQIIIGPSFEKKLKRIKIKNTRLFRKIRKQLKVFSQNPKHQSLRLHKLKGDLKEVWSISVDHNFRLVFINKRNEFYFFDMGTHDEVYR